MAKAAVYPLPMTPPRRISLGAPHPTWPPGAPRGRGAWVSRSLRHRRRPSPFVWRVGIHIEFFEACSVFTHVAARMACLPPTRRFQEVLQPIRCLLDRSLCFRPERELAGSNWAQPRPNRHRRINRAFARHAHEPPRTCAWRAIPTGRKNWLFAWTELGAKHAGIVKSLLVTCRLKSVPLQADPIFGINQLHQA